MSRPDPTTSRAGDAPILSVRGGSEGTAAHYAEMAQLASTVDQASADLVRRAALGGRVMADSDLVESAILAPATFAKAEAAVLLATTGPSGLTVQGGTLKIDAFLLRVTVDTYQEVDALQRAAYEAMDYVVGFQLAIGAPVLALGGAVVWARTTPAQRKAMAAALEDWAAKHPGAVEHLLNGSGGLLDGLHVWERLLTAPVAGPGGGHDPWSLLGLDPFHPSTGSAAKDIAGLYQDGDPRVGDPRAVDTVLGNRAPGDVADLMRGLQETNADETEGYIRIQTVRVGDEIRYIAYLPGTDDMATKPFGSDDTIRDMGANLRLMGGENTAYGRGIVEALNRATAGDPDAHVMLVGHSQGGMTAAQLASMDRGASGAHFAVDHVVTAGAPNSQVPHLPGGTDMLSLENNGDAIPLTDGEPNPDAPNRTTVRFDDPGPSIAENHDMRHYVEGGAAVDRAARGDATGSLAHSVQSLDDYLDGARQVRTDSVVITRVQP